jgi:hypothetical protein
MDGAPKLARLLEHPAIWRGRSAARLEVLPSGFAALDERLPGGGWPRSGLIEILIARFGSGELYLLLPALAALTRATGARWCVWVAPPLMPFAPALATAGLALDRIAVVGGARPLWAFEQVLGSGACDAALAWAPPSVAGPWECCFAREAPHVRHLRRCCASASRRSPRACASLF